MPPTLCAPSSSRLSVRTNWERTPESGPGEGEGGVIKVLDLLLNRYYVGRVRMMDREILEMDVPRSARLQPGQRIRFVLADGGNRGIVSRRAMRSAVVMRRSMNEDGSMSVEVSLSPEMAAA